MNTWDALLQTVASTRTRGPLVPAQTHGTAHTMTLKCEIWSV
jgi:hypothetical protein